MTGSLLIVLWGVLALLLEFLWIGGALSTATSLLGLAAATSCALIFSLRAWWSEAAQQIGGPKPNAHEIAS